MPIANCLVSPNCKNTEHNLVELWSTESGQSAKHMTVNISTIEEQYGSKYSAMATLYLPSLWSEPAISSLQTGLARAIATKYGLSLEEVHVITTIVESGLVVESGKEEKW